MRESIGGATSELERQIAALLDQATPITTAEAVELARGSSARANGVSLRQRARSIAAAVVALLLIVGVVVGVNAVRGSRHAGENPVGPPHLTGPLGWSSGTIVDRTTGPPVSLSCRTMRFCVEIDGDGNARTFNGSAWSAPTNLVEPDLAPCPEDCGSTGPLVVQCPTVAFCMAVTLSGQSFIDDDGVWHKGALWSRKGGPAPWLSCTSPTFCMAINRSLTYTPGSTGGGPESYASVFNGSRWSKPVGVPLRWVGGVSCVRSRFCVATDGSGNVSEWSGASWSAPVAVDTGSRLPGLDLSCGAVGHCVAVNELGAVFVLRAGVWSSQGSTIGGPAALSCATATFCVEASDGGAFRTLHGDVWSAPVQLSSSERPLALSCPVANSCIEVGTQNSRGIGSAATTYSRLGADGWSRPELAYGDLGDPEAVSCSSVGSCGVIGGRGSIFETAGKWARPVGAPGEMSPYASIACQSDMMCIVVNDNDAYIARNGAWSGPTKIDVPGVLVGLSCPNAADCVAVDDAGNTASWNGKSWSRASAIGTRRNAPFVVSCPAVGTCFAIDRAGEFMATQHGRWNALPESDLDNPITLSCPTTSSCLAVSQHGYAAAYRNGHWFAPVHAISLGGSEAAVTCASMSFCVVTGTQSGTAAVFNGRRWSSVTKLTADGQLSAPSCPVVGWCTVVDGAGKAFTYRARDSR